MTPSSIPSGLGETLGSASRRTIPFDYAFRYELTGEPGHLLRRVVTVSIEATFVAVSIGYGVVPKVSPTRFGPVLPPSQLGSLALAEALTPRFRALQELPFGALIAGLGQKLQEPPVGGRIVGARVAEVLTNGIKLNPEIAERVLLGDVAAPLDDDILDELFQAVAAPVEQIQFKYAIFDDGSGREFQSEPILNIAGLGISNGDRPFRYFAKPITFTPRSAIRMEVTELSEFQGELHVSLQGYKVLGAAGSPTGRTRPTARRSRRG